MCRSGAGWAEARCSTASTHQLPCHFIVAPLTTGEHRYPFYVGCRFDGNDGHVVLDQLRTFNRLRLTRRLGALTAETQGKVLTVLREIFAV
ncbi:MAG: type II toxin-antitoxin system PemK/MazF family toxin [Gemmatimonas sp.]|nr:type II toxin-antitoxin system PemK/MazF family toxin [Gemmatimonas sp.]